MIRIRFLVPVHVCFHFELVTLTSVLPSRSHRFSWWNTELLEPEFHNVVVDWHIYDWQAPRYNEESYSKHLLDAQGWATMIAE